MSTIFINLFPDSRDCISPFILLPERATKVYVNGIFSCWIKYANQTIPHQFCTLLSGFYTFASHRSVKSFKWRLWKRFGNNNTVKIVFADICRSQKMHFFSFIFFIIMFRSEIAAAVCWSVKLYFNSLNHISYRIEDFVHWPFIDFRNLLEHWILVGNFNWTFSHSFGTGNSMNPKHLCIAAVLNCAFGLFIKMIE